MTAAPAQSWVGLRRQAIGTSVHVLVTEPDQLPAAEELVVAELAALDVACSRFREDAELVGLVPGAGPVAISPVLAGALSAALWVAEYTGGLVQPTLARALQAAGYDRTFRSLPPDGPTAVRLPMRPDLWREIVLNGDQLTLPAGAELDLGASAKAWCADQLAQQIADLGTGVLVNLGGDIATGGTGPDGGWPVGIADRPDDGRLVQTVMLESGALATSSTTARTWRRGGLVMHHILDPVTGAPVEPYWDSVSVCAPTCLMANAASTAAIVLGDDAPGWLEESGLPACLLGRSGAVVRLNGWPHDAEGS